MFVTNGTNGTMILPNPTTPMAYLPPQLAFQITNLTYGAVGSLAVLLWDIILHSPQDYKLVTQYRINFLFITYLIARVSTLAYIFGVVLLTTIPVNHCNLLRQISILSPFTVPLSVLPFVFRVSALYSNNKFVVVFLSTTWLFVLASYIIAPIETVGVRIEHTMYCLNIRSKLGSALTSSSVLVHDLLIFVATCWAFMRNSYSGVNVKNTVRVMVFGRNLPAFSRSILRDGQGYFLAILFFNFFLFVLCYVPNSPIAPCAISLPFFVMLNNMTSHVYRNLRFGYYRTESTMITSTMIENALHQPDQSHRCQELVFGNPKSEEGMEGDLESGDLTSSKGSLGLAPSQGIKEEKNEV